MTDINKEPKNIIEAQEIIRRYEKFKRMEAKASKLFLSSKGVSNPEIGTYDYVACVFLDEEDKPIRKFLVGKPYGKDQQDHTKKGGGPYIVDLTNGKSCNCPYFIGIPEHEGAVGQIVSAVEGEGECKHHIAILYFLSRYEYELLPIKGVTNRKLIRWKV
jgi:hypothetical protein